MPQAVVLIVEDELEIAELIQFHIEREGYTARVVQSGRIALDVVKREKPDLIMLDLMLPDVDGLEVCRRLKWEEASRDIPILMVTAKGEESDIVAGIELGADDYVTKPFSPRVLMARVKNIIRRQHEQAAAQQEGRSNRVVLADGSMVIDADRHEVLMDNEPLNLTLTEYSLLLYLAARPGFVRTRDQIISAVRGKSTVLSSRTVDVHITALRRKMGELGGMIETVRGVGYRLVEPVPAGDDEEA